MFETKHPIETIFDIEAGSTELIDYTVDDVHQIPASIEYDDKDDDIEAQIQNIHDVALIGYQQQMEFAQLGDPKFAARSMEVATQLLNTGLQALRERAALKVHKDKLAKDRAKGTPQTNITNNTLVVGSRSEILKKLKSGGI
jgi:hypothetical protein